MSLWYVVPLNTYLDLVSYLKDIKIRFNCKSNLTSAIGIFSKLRHLAGYVSHHNAMAYDRDMQPPNKALQLEWFYMSFHSEDCAKYVESGQRLRGEMLESVAEYFENTFNLQVADGSLAKKRECQIKQCVRCEMRHKLCKQYDEKVRCVTE
jgi:hypothetical protein